MPLWPCPRGCPHRPCPPNNSTVTPARLGGAGARVSEPGPSDVQGLQSRQLLRSGVPLQAATSLPSIVPNGGLRQRWRAASSGSPKRTCKSRGLRARGRKTAGGRLEAIAIRLVQGSPPRPQGPKVDNSRATGRQEKDNTPTQGSGAQPGTVAKLFGEATCMALYGMSTCIGVVDAC